MSGEGLGDSKHVVLEVVDKFSNGAPDYICGVSWWSSYLPQVVVNGEHLTNAHKHVLDRDEK